MDRDRPAGRASALVWHAVQELLTYLRSDESPRESFARIEDDDERAYFLRLMQTSGWSVPPSHSEQEQDHG